MDSSPSPPPLATAPIATRVDYFAIVAAVVLMAAALGLHLLSALIAGLLVHELIQSVARRLHLASVGRQSAKVLALALLTIVVIGVVSAAIVSVINLLRHGGDSLPALLDRIAVALETSRERLPEWLSNLVPSDVNDLRQTLVGWLHEHSATLQGFGKSFGRGLAHILIGMIIGAMLAVRESLPQEARGPLARGVSERVLRLAQSFRRVVFAQAWIASINALLTWLYLGVILPVFGVDLPQVKTLVTVTWVAGLMPIVGNLISNSVIVAVSFVHSLGLAVASLGFLIVIHKLEYFLNARIIGAHIRAYAWELLAAMLVMETAFGIAGLIAAPIFYAYLKDELARLRLI